MRREPAGATYFSAMCCRSRSPVESEMISYFFVSRDVSVPLPAPGFPANSSAVRAFRQLSFPWHE